MGKVVTEEPLEAGDVEGLKRPERLVELFNTLQGASAASLNGTRSTGLTLGNVRHVLLEDKELVAPSDWTPLEPASGSGWVDSGPGAGYGALGVRKTLDGIVHIREFVTRAAGAPAPLSTITTVPALFAPAVTVRRTGESALANTLAGWGVTPAGAVQWLFGNPTAGMTLTGSWHAADPTMPEWPTPLRVKVEERYTLRRVFVEARRADAGEDGLQVAAEVLGARIEPPQAVGERPTLIIPRITGLREGGRYRLTLLLLVE